jgi:hypothetical protein
VPPGLATSVAVDVFGEPDSMSYAASYGSKSKRARAATFLLSGSPVGRE